MYRFEMNGFEVECETAAELHAALSVEFCDIGLSPAQAAATTNAAPEAAANLAMELQQRGDRKAAEPLRETPPRTKGEASRHSWELARFYSEHVEPKYNVVQARSRLSANAALRANIELAYARHRGAA